MEARIRRLSRWQAFFGHFCSSLLLGLGIFLLFRTLWYPDAYWNLSDAGKLLLTIVGVDVTLGPLLTLAVFNPRKRLLMMDLGIILALQLGALAYGLKVMAESRPVFLVAAVDRLVIVAANEVEREDLAGVRDPTWRTLSWTGPVLVGSRNTLEGEARSDFLFETLASGRDIEDFPRFYVPFAESRAELLARSLAVDDPSLQHKPDYARFRRAFDDTGLDAASTRLVLLGGRSGFGVMAVDAVTAMPRASFSIDLF
jgi:hypothetical protein